MLVTGGAGFIGSNFVRAVLAGVYPALAGATVTVLDNLTYSGNTANLPPDADRLTFVRGDICDGRLVGELMPGHDAVVHFAAESHVDRSILGATPFVTTNVLGTQVLLDAARIAGVGRFLHVSTDEVYGSIEEGEWTEDWPLAPNSPYAASKAAADHLVRAYHETYGLPTLLTNCSNNYGPYQFPEKLIPLMILNAMEGKSLPIYGDGGNVRDWVYVDDHCAGILLALAKGRPGAKYNIGGDNERTNLEIVDRLCAALEAAWPARDNPALAGRGIACYADLKTFVADRPGHDRRYAIDGSKIRAELGWAPAHEFADGIARTVRWYVEHRDWCLAVQSGRYGRERLGIPGAAPTR